MANLSSYKGKPWSAWISSLEGTGLLGAKEEEPDSEVTLLPREDSVLYGICPKLEVFRAVECSKCGAVVKPQALSRHIDIRHSRDPILPPPQLPIREHKLPKSKSKKPALPPPAPPPPPLEVPSTPQLVENSPSSSSNRHRKPSRKNTKSRDYENDKHPRVEENHKAEPGSWQRASTCTPQQVAHKSRSKSNKDYNKQTSSNTPTSAAAAASSSVPTSEHSRSKEGSSGSSKHHMAPITVSIATTTNVPELVRIAASQPQVPISVPLTSFNATPVTQSNERETDSGYSSSQSSTETLIHTPTSTPTMVYTLPIIHLTSSGVAPASPSLYLYTTSPTTPIEPPSVRLASPQPASSPPLSSQSLFTVALSDQLTNITFYNSHPKPLAMSTFSTRRIGNSIVLPSHRVEKQRNDIQMALQAKRTSPAPPYRPVSVLNTHHRPNILKNTGTRASPKILPNALKRVGTERLEGTDCKQLALATYCTMT